MLDDLGLGAALEWQARQHSRLCGVPVSVDLDGAENLSDSQRTCVYRVVQEALTNIARHAQARNIEVSVKTSENVISILVRDDGSGFDVEEAGSGKGLGLLGIKERVRQLGGEASIESQRGLGTRLKAWLPLETKGEWKKVAS
jgi:signal transduction histidine kinase